MKEHKKVIKSDKKLLAIIFALIVITGILFIISNHIENINSAAIVRGFAFFAFIPLTIICILVYLMYMIDFIPFKIKSKKYYKDLEDELAKENTIFYKDKEYRTYLTDKYIVRLPEITKEGYILEYSKLNWIYIEEVMETFNSSGSSVRNDYFSIYNGFN